MTRNKKDWEVYCEKTFNNLRANAQNWGSCSNWNRALTRDFYLGVFDAGTPNKTGLISEDALFNHVTGKKNQNTLDHCLSPQFVARMILDNPDKYLTDYELFRSIFFECCKTIIVTKGENKNLSLLTENNQGSISVEVPTHLKYKHLGINLYKSVNGKWNDCVEVDNIISVPESITEYEKDFVTNAN